MSLCTNRPEGFGPASSLSSPLPTSCFTDVILIPLPVWLYLAGLPLCLLLAHFRRRRNFNPSTMHLRTAPQRSCLRSTLTTIYYLLIIANILMQILEIVRLELINNGIGLLPFTWVALLLVFGGHLFNAMRKRVESSWIVGLNVFVWIGLCVMSVVKTVELVYMEDNGYTRIGSKYPVSDQVIDVGVMAGVYLALAILEAVIAVWRRKASGIRQDGVDGVETKRWER